MARLVALLLVVFTLFISRTSAKGRGGSRGGSRSGVNHGGGGGWGPRPSPPPFTPPRERGFLGVIKRTCQIGFRRECIRRGPLLCKEFQCVRRTGQAIARNEPVGVGWEKRRYCSSQFNVKCYRQGDAVCSKTYLGGKWRCCKNNGSGPLRPNSIESCNFRAPPPHEYLGCYKDNSTRMFKRDFGSHAFQTNRGCRERCQKEGFPYAGTQHSDQCFCGTESEFQKLVKRPEAECRMKCPGWRRVKLEGEKDDWDSKSQWCGGHWRMHVSKLTKDFPCLSEKRKLFGTTFYKQYPQQFVHGYCNGEWSSWSVLQLNFPRNHCKENCKSGKTRTRQIAVGLFKREITVDDNCLLSLDHCAKTDTCLYKAWSAWTDANRCVPGVCQKTFYRNQEFKPEPHWHTCPPGLFQEVKIGPDTCPCDQANVWGQATAIRGEEEIASTNDLVSGSTMVQSQGEDNYSLSVAALVISIVVLVGVLLLMGVMFSSRGRNSEKF